jgi:hypothetical protein
MAGQLVERWRLAAIGAVGGAAIWALVDSADRGAIGDQPALIGLALLGTWLAASLAMAGPIGLWRALPRALGLGVVTAFLVWLGGLRFEDGILGSPILVLAALTVATLPVPFLIAAARNGWRDYPALFLEAWSIVVRFAAAWAFTGLVWLVIYLSDEVLQIVGIRLITELLRHGVVPMVLTGAILGLGMAVVHELAELLSPYLVLRLFRLLLPVVLVVVVVFLLALPFRGLSGLFNGLSPTLLLLAMVAAGISLVSIAIDQTDAEATQSPLLRRAAQGMSLVLPVLGGLAAWGIWLRVAQHGWTPDRLFVVLIAVLGLVYGLTYALAVLRGTGWMERIRQGNIRMALAVVGLAALWLTPILNAEAISARSQLARFEAGQTALADLDLRALGGWGHPGAAALARLAERAREPGQEALANRLAGQEATPETDRATLASDLADVMPVQPETATGTRDSLLAAAQDYQLRDWLARCQRKVAAARPACLMAVGDLLPNRPGEEAILILERGSDYFDLVGLYIGDDGLLVHRLVLRGDGSHPSSSEIADLVEAWSDAPPPLTAAPINQLGTGETGLLIVP